MATLKELGEKAVLSQRDLAEKSGISYATVCRIETSQQKPHFKTIRKLAKALGVAPGDIDFS